MATTRGRWPGQAAPTPGGIAVEEAAMIAAMNTLGLHADAALTTVFLDRIAGSWMISPNGPNGPCELEADGLP